MRTLFFLLLLPSLCFSAEATETLTALLVCDTHSNLKATVKSDQGHMLSALKMIAHKTKMHLVTQCLAGKQATARKVEEMTAALAKSDGVSLFYFSGHGFRWPGSRSPWPHLVFLKEKEQISGDRICNRLRQGHARLTIVIFDCCNQFLKEKMIVPFVVSKELPFKKNASLEALKTLFVKSRGSVVVAAAVPGETARGTSMGSFFTTSFLETLSSQQGNASWQDIFAETQRKCSTSNQHPFCQFSLAPMN